MEARHAIFDYLVERISQFDEVQRIVLFGSRARGDHQERSDIDLAVDAPGMDSRRWYDIVDLVEEAPTLLMIDLVRLDEARGKFLDRIIQHAVPLYER